MSERPPEKLIRGGSGQTLCSKRSELQRAERADASEASEGPRMRAVVYMKLLTRQPKKPQISHTKQLHISQQAEVQGVEGGGGVQGCKPKDNEHQ